MTFRKFSKRATLVSVLLGILLASSVAFAAWTATSTGSGYAQSQTLSGLTTSVTVATAQLHPGGQADVFITLNNSNNYPLTVTNINGTGLVTITSGNATCDNPAAPYTGNGVSWVSNKVGTWTVPATGTLAVTLTNAVAMTNNATTANNSCQGQTFTVAGLQFVTTT